MMTDADPYDVELVSEALAPRPIVSEARRS
jgi:hypothetical protein